jgi:hypothetical protein
MTQSTLRAVTLQTLANYTQAAELAVGAYKAGGERLIAVLQQGLSQQAAGQAERVAPRLATALRRAGDNASELANKGLEAVSSRTEQVIAFSAAGVTAQIERVADLAAKVENDTLASGLQTISRLGLPGAQAALALSERVAAGAGKLAELAGARSTRAGQAAKRLRRAAPARGRTAAKVVTEAAAKAEVQAKAVVKRASTAASKSVAAPKKAVTKAVAKVAKVDVANPFEAAPAKATRTRRAPAKSAAVVSEAQAA